MTYSFGANGLNLIEATHVLLVEPTLNRSQEIQAIGRVHRIGQTKPTFVYRFLVNNTIEDLVYNLFKKNSYQNIDNAQPNTSTVLHKPNGNDSNKIKVHDLENLLLNL